MRYRVVMVAAFLTGMAAFQGTSLAQPYRARQGVQSGQVRSLDQILNGIRRQRPGNLADVQGPIPSPAGEPRYRLKWVTPDGRVLWLDTDARTGRVLGVEGEDRVPGLPPPGYGVPPAPPPPPAYRGIPPGAVPGALPPGYGPVPPPYGPPVVVPQPRAYGPPVIVAPRVLPPRGAAPGAVRIPLRRERGLRPGR